MGTSDSMDNQRNNPIFIGMEIDAYKKKDEEPEKYFNYHRLTNDEYIKRHKIGMECQKQELLMLGKYNYNTTAFNIDHYFPEGYNILPFYKRVNVESLSLGEINNNKYIVLKIVSKLYQVKAILFLGEDDNKNILKISIYNYSNYFNTNSEEELQKIYDIGKYIICINSFYKVYTSMDDGLRIESPAETILLDNLKELNYFFEKNNNRNIKNLKELGNFFMQKNNYEKAIYYYEESIKLIKNEQKDSEEIREINIITHSNLIEAYLKYGYYTKALLYANKGFKLLKDYNNDIKKERKIKEKVESQKQKILYRKIRALKGLRLYYKIYELIYDRLPKDFKKNNLKIFDIFYKEYNSNIKLSDFLSESEIKKILTLPEFKKILIELEEKIENEKGHYNFYKLIKLEEKYFNLDLGNYYNSKIYLDFDYKKGLSIKANEFIRRGELIIAEKAVIAMNVNSKEFPREVNKITGKKMSLEDDILTYNFLLESFKKFPNDYKILLLLYNGENGKMNLEQRFEKIDEAVTQDKITNIIVKNRHATRRNVYYPNEISNGLFLISSFINHSCEDNACYEGIGDFIFCFAIKDIHEGEEINISYIDSKFNYQKRKQILSAWNIECDCNLCKNDLETMNKDYKIKINEYIDFFSHYKYKANINKENFDVIAAKIYNFHDYVLTNKNRLTSYEVCYCLIHIFNFYAFINDIGSVKFIKEQFFNIEKYNYFTLSLELLNSNLKFNGHLIDINYKDGDKLYNESVNELIQYLKKLTPYQEDSIREMINSNIKQFKIDFKK